MAFDWIAGTALVVGVGSLYLTYQSTKSAKRAIETSIELYEKQKKDDEERKKIENINEIRAIKNIACTESFALLQHVKFLHELSVTAVKADYIDKKSTQESNYNGVFLIDKNKDVIESSYVPEMPIKFSHDFILIAAKNSIQLSDELSDINLHIGVIEEMYKYIFSYIDNNDIENLKASSNAFFNKIDDEKSLASMIVQSSVVFNDEMERVYIEYPSICRYLKEIGLL